MDWIRLEELSQIDTIIEESKQAPVVIFKHSIRCSISSMAINRIERSWKADHTKAYYLDLINYRDISNKVAEVFGIQHQSPQILVIENGKCIYDDSHMAIHYATLESYIHTSAASN